MSRRKSRTLTELELEIMLVIWDRGNATVEEIRKTLDNEGRPLALPSIRTMLGILQEKGYVNRRQEGRRHVYMARVGRQKARKSILHDVMDRAFEGSIFNLVATLVDTRPVSPDELRKLKDLIRDHEKQEGR